MDRETWLLERRKGLGSSDAPAILGLSQWRTPLDIFYEKLGEEVEDEDNFDKRRGRALEGLCISEYAERNGYTIERPTFLRHPSIPWLFCSPDAVAVLPDGRRRVIEAKTRRHSKGFGDAESDEVPDDVLAQTHHILIIAAAIGGFDDEVAVPVLFAGSEYREFRVAYHQAIEAEMLRREAEFWRLVETRTPPPVTRVAEATRQWGKLARPGSVVADASEIDIYQALKAATETQKDFEKQIDAGKSRLMAALADRGDTLVDAEGNVLATWRLNNGTKGYTIEPKEPARIFRLK